MLRGEGSQVADGSVPGHGSGPQGPGADRQAGAVTRQEELLATLRTVERMLLRYRTGFRELASELRHLRGTPGNQRTAPHWSATVVRALRQRSGGLRPLVSSLWGLRRTARVSPRDHEAEAVTVPVIPMALQPEVSIVVPVHDQWVRTAMCLRSIALEPCAVGYEVVVVDDASTDETVTRLRSVVGATVVRLEENVGFLRAVNAGLAAARGRYVVLLNNDTIVQPGWLDALVETADSDPEIGVVGAKLVYPDGRLQEAGGVIFDDGSGHNYGRDQDTLDPLFNFVREVDYCSGACLLVRAELIRVLGGLDSRFSPAYYEDTDLCFAARQHGFRVVYQPAAVVVHYEGASHGTDIGVGVKRYQEVNRTKFLDKWSAVLPSQGRADLATVRASSWRTLRGRALVVDHQLPMPDHDSGSRRMAELLGLLGGLGFGVTFVPQNGIDLPQYREALTSRGVEVLRGPQDLDAYVRGVLPDLRLIILSRPTVAWSNYPMLRSLAPDAVLVYDTVDLHYLRERRRAEVDGGSQALKSAAYHYGMEMALARLADQTWVVSDVEAELLAREDPGIDIAVVPNIHRVEPPGPPHELREGLLFVGNFAHHPNRDAAQWLVEEVLDLVRRELGSIPVVLAGSNVTPDVEALAGEGVVVLGWVPRLDEWYRRSRLFVAPLRYGAGMKGKVGEALAFGLPVVTTPAGAEGMGLEDGSDVLVRSDARSFAEGVIELYRDARLWGHLAVNGRRAVAERLSPARVSHEIARALQRKGLRVK